MDNSWKQDPRLKAMNKDKLAMLTEFAERIEHSDKNNLMESGRQTFWSTSSVPGCLPLRKRKLIY